jgi:putative FmdB family regulatory protein
VLAAVIRSARSQGRRSTRAAHEEIWQADVTASMRDWLRPLASQRARAWQTMRRRKEISQAGPLTQQYAEQSAVRHQVNRCPAVIISSTRKSGVLMPIYEYSCSSCSQSFDLIRPWPARNNPTNCTWCGESDVQRRVASRISSPQGEAHAGPAGPQVASTSPPAHQDFEPFALRLPSHSTGRSQIGHFVSVGMPRGVVAEGSKHDADRLDITGAKIAVDLKNSEMRIEELNVE